MLSGAARSEGIVALPSSNVHLRQSVRNMYKRLCLLWVSKGRAAVASEVVEFKGVHMREAIRGTESESRAAKEATVEKSWGTRGGAQAQVKPRQSLSGGSEIQDKENLSLSSTYSIK